MPTPLIVLGAVAVPVRVEPSRHGAFASAASNSGSVAHWIVAVAAGLIALWFVGLMVRAFRAS